MLDEDGNKPLEDRAPPRFSEVPGGIAMFLLTAGYLSVLVPAMGLLAPATALIGAGAMAAAVGVGLLRVPSRRRKRFDARRRELAATALATAGAPAAIEGDGARPIRVRGRVDVLRPVPGPDGSTKEVAAWQTAEGRSCGRCAVVGGTTVAMVDDDCFEVWERGLGSAGGVVEDGMEIEVAGRAGRAPAGDAAAVVSTTYRGDCTVLLFDGSEADPVRLFV